VAAAAFAKPSLAFIAESMSGTVRPSLDIISLMLIRPLPLPVVGLPELVGDTVPALPLPLPLPFPLVWPTEDDVVDG